MKFIHLADLHLGKVVNGYSMIKEQKHILGEIENIIEEEKPDAVIIAGDVYDRQVAPTEAIGLFEDFLNGLVKAGIPSYIVSGNHDSAERLAPHRRLMDGTGVHFSSVYEGECQKYTLNDEYGPVNIYLLPFIKPVHVRAAFPEAQISSYTDAVKVAVDALNVNEGERNVLVSHQFVTGAQLSGSEDMALMGNTESFTFVGGLDNVEANVFDAFDYVALGHIHRPQNVTGKAVMRYAGSPLKYSFSEAGYEKSLTVVEMGEKGSVQVRTVPLKPLHDMVEITGKFDDVISNPGQHKEDYVRIVLTDEEDVPNAAARLQGVYENFMELTYDNVRTRAELELADTAKIEGKSVFEIFSEFYESQNGKEMSEEQAAFMAKIIDDARGQE